MKIEILNAHICDPLNAIDRVDAIYLADTKILSIGEPPSGWQAEQSIDASGLYCIPGLVDIAARLGNSGQTQQKSISSETHAAVSAGITSLVCMPDSKPVIDSAAQLEYVQQHCHSSSHCHVYVIAALTTGLKGDMLSEMAALKQAGCVGVSNVMHPLANNLVLRRAMEYASGQGLTLHYQAMDSALQANGCINEGLAATRMGLIGIPNAAETAAVGVCLALIEHTGARVHFARLSTQRAVHMLELAHSEGLNVSADVAAHQLFLCDDDIPAFDPNFHLLPPLRSADDLAGLHQAINNPIFSAICSDHQPHCADAKLAPFASTQIGASALETLLPLTLRLVEQGLLNLQQAIALVTYKPAQMLNIDAGSLTAGSSADLCLFDPKQEWTLQANTMRSRGKHSPFLGQRFKGKVKHTFVSGKLVYSES